MSSAAPCQHVWQLVETGYVRTWSTSFDPDTKTITASWGGSEDFSESGSGDDHLQCTLCLETQPLPDDWTIEYD